MVTWAEADRVPTAIARPRNFPKLFIIIKGFLNRLSPLFLFAIFRIAENYLFHCENVTYHGGPPAARPRRAGLIIKFEQSCSSSSSNFSGHCEDENEEDSLGTPFSDARSCFKFHP